MVLHSATKPPTKKHPPSPSPSASAAIRCTAPRSASISASGRRPARRSSSAAASKSSAAAAGLGRNRNRNGTEGRRGRGAEKMGGDHLWKWWVYLEKPMKLKYIDKWFNSKNVDWSTKQTCGFGKMSELSSKDWHGFNWFSAGKLGIWNWFE